MNTPTETYLHTVHTVGGERLLALNIASVRQHAKREHGAIVTIFVDPHADIRLLERNNPGVINGTGRVNMPDVMVEPGDETPLTFYNRRAYLTVWICRDKEGRLFVRFERGNLKEFLADDDQATARFKRRHTRRYPLRRQPEIAD